MAVPQASSPDFEDASRTVSNEVDVFKTERAASDALALYAKSSTVGCLKKIFEKRLRQEPSLKGKVAAVVVTIERQDIAGLGDDSVVYEGIGRPHRHRRVDRQARDRQRGGAGRAAP